MLLTAVHTAQKECMSPCPFLNDYMKSAKLGVDYDTGCFFSFWIPPKKLRVQDPMLIGLTFL